MVDAEAWAALGRALRREAGCGGGPLTELAQGSRRTTGSIRACLGPAVFGALLREGVLERVGDGSEVACTIRLLAGPEFVVAAPEAGQRPDKVYLGPDSRLLAEAALRLAPWGERAVDLGTGTGLLAAAISRRYRCVVATDIVQRSARAARHTMLVNDRPDDHIWLTAQSDVGRGLAPQSFDLVTANTPWVPSGAEHAGPVRTFADGGHDGVELPARFLLEGAALLRPGGTAVTLALHVSRADGTRPLLERCDRLQHEGFTVAVIPTPINAAFPDLPAKTRARAPDLVEALHVAVVVGAPDAGGGRRDSLLVACESLARRWGTATLSRECLAVGARS